MYRVVFDMFEFQSKLAKPHKASSTKWVDHHMNGLSNFVDKFWLHFEVTADTTKRRVKASLKAKRREINQAEVLLFSVLFMDIHEPIGVFSLTTQKEMLTILGQLSI